MKTNTFPTKANLITAQNTLQLAKQGYDLMEKKRHVLMQEIMNLEERAQEIQKNIETVFGEAYAALQEANIRMGAANVARFSRGVPRETSIRIQMRNVMGVEIPSVTYDPNAGTPPFFSFADTSLSLDETFVKFRLVKHWIIQLSAVENAAYRLAAAIKKTRKRANALHNITIPRCEALVKTIQETLEEQERDVFARLKVVKDQTR